MGIQLCLGIGCVVAALVVVWLWSRVKWLAMSVALVVDVPLVLLMLVVHA